MITKSNMYQDIIKSIQEGGAAEKLGEGFCNDIYLLERDLLLKIAKIQVPNEVRELNTLSKEVEIIRELHELAPQLPLQRIVYASETSEAYVYEKIHGVPLNAYLGDVQQYHDFLVQFIAGVASVTEELDQRVQLVHEKQLPDSSNWQLESWEKIAALLEGRQKEGLETFLPELLSAMAHKVDRYAMHNDLHGGNIIVDPVSGEARGVIDFGDFCMSDLHAEAWNIAKIDPELAVRVMTTLAQKGFEVDPKKARVRAMFSWMFKSKDREDAARRFLRLEELGWV